MIRLATEKSLQADLKKLKSSDDFAQSWQQLLIMYQSRYEKRRAWKEKAQDFEKIEQALEEQQKELETIEKKLPKPLKIKKKKEKPVVPRSKAAVVCVLDLENKTAEPFGDHPIDDEEEEEEVKEKEEPVQPKPPPKEKKVTPTETPMETESNDPSEKSNAFVINDPFFLNSDHHITYQKRTTREKNDADLDDKAFIEHSYFIDALSSSSNRRDGAGEYARRKWAHLDLPSRSRSAKKGPMKNGRCPLLFRSSNESIDLFTVRNNESSSKRQ